MASSGGAAAPVKPRVVLRFAGCAAAGREEAAEAEAGADGDDDDHLRGLPVLFEDSQAVGICVGAGEFPRRGALDGRRLRGPEVDARVARGFVEGEVDVVGRAAFDRRRDGRRVLRVATVTS